jgi:hypothetical protein
MESGRELELGWQSGSEMVEALALELESENQR